MTGKRQVLILQSPQDKTRFGILADSLGDIAEISLSQIESVSGMMSEGGSLVESLVKPQAGSGERRILVVLSVEKIYQRLSGCELVEQS